MKTTLLSLILILSFSFAQAQDTDQVNQSTDNTSKASASKVDFFKTLVAVNKFDIKIKEDTTKKVAKAETKIEFYRALMIKNSLDKKVKVYSRLAEVNETEENRKSSFTNQNQTVGLRP